MLPTDNPRHYLIEFFKILLHPKNIPIETFQPSYYRAILVDSNVRHCRRFFLKGDYKSLCELMNSILVDLPNKTERDLEENLNLTLYNILKFHLDSYLGRENTEKNLEEIERELSNLVNSIFLNKAPFRLCVEDTVQKRDDDKIDGSKFRIRIVPFVVDKLLF